MAVELDSLKSALRKNTSTGETFNVLIPVTHAQSKDGSNIRGYVMVQVGSPEEVMEEIVELTNAGFDVHVWEPSSYKKNKFSKFS